jgi:hypothetical protein
LDGVHTSWKVGSGPGLWGTAAFARSAFTWESYSARVRLSLYGMKHSSAMLARKASSRPMLATWAQNLFSVWASSAQSLSWSPARAHGIAAASRMRSGMDFM